MIPASLSETWAYFSDPHNLAFITPPKLAFKVTSDVADEMYEGMILTARVAPFLGIGLTWVTEITRVVPQKMFIDEQRLGPFKFWHHEHFFEERDSGVLMRDVVHYAVPFWPLGEIVHLLAVRGALDRIFAFRRQAVESIFGL